MKTALIILIFSLIAKSVFSQLSTGKITDLAVPSSAAFVITDITPTLVQDPGTPKSFVLGIAQSFQKSGNGFPDNYSVEFAPYWWMDPKGRNVYKFLGLSSFVKDGKTTWRENPALGLNFTSISVAFINKDLIPDTSTATQKIFSIGARTTLIKLYQNGHARQLGEKIAEWETAAQQELNDNQTIIIKLARLDSSDPNYAANRLKILNGYKESKTPDIFKEVNDLIVQKPVFSWDVAAAWAVYGINNQEIKTGRAATWTTLSSYIPLSKDVANNYFNINFSVRYLMDNFQKNDHGIGKANNLDFGGNAGLAFNQLTIAIESLYRYSNGIANSKNRTVGIIKVKVADNIYINGTFGKDFDGPNKLISAFGLNWGFGKEQITLPVSL
jgi:hypothetical protein